MFNDNMMLDELGNLLTPEEMLKRRPAGVQINPMEPAMAQPVSGSIPAGRPSGQLADTSMPPIQMAQAPQGLLDRLRSGMDERGISSNDALMAIGSGLLGLSNDQGLQQLGLSGFGQIAKGRETREAKTKADAITNRTVEELRRMKRDDLADAVMSGMLPAAEAAKYIFKLKSGTGTPAELQTFEAMAQGLPDDERARARRIALGLDPRAASSLSISPELLAQRAYMTEGGRGTATAEIESAQSNAAREAGMRMFEYGLGNLEEALAGTTTGAFAGLIPAITGSQQTAEQAIAMMAPLLKNTFRAAGEGVFTDKDQELLLAMLPTRGTSSDVAAKIIQNIRMLVEFKLSSGSSASVEEMRSRFGLESTGSSQQPATPPPATPPAQTDGFKIKSVK